MTGQPMIRRPDRTELLEIKAGRFAYEDLMTKAAEELRQIDEGFAAGGLPNEPDSAQIERWVIEIRRRW